MKVDGIVLQALKPLEPPSWTVENREKAANGEKSFASYLQDALSQVNQLQKQAQLSAMQLAAGEEPDLHRTMVAYEKAALALQLTIEIRNKLTEAYQEIMRIQM